MSTSLQVTDLDSYDSGSRPEGDRQIADLVPLVKRWWRPWLLFVGGATLIAIIVSLLLPPRFTASATVMSVGTGMPQGALGRLARIANIMPTRDELPAETLTTILASRRVADGVLSKEYRPAPDDERSKPFRNWLTGTEPGEKLKRDSVYRQFKQATTFRIDPETRIVHVKVETRYPHMSAAVCNDLVDELSRYATEEHQAKSRVVRGFVGERMDEVELELRAAEDELHAFYAVNQNYMKTADPDIQIERLRFERQLEMKSRLLIELASQYEAAMIEERNEAPMIQVIDRATVPDLRSWPKRKPMVGITMVLAALVGIAGVLIADSRMRQQQAPVGGAAALERDAAAGSVQRIEIATDLSQVEALQASTLHDSSRERAEDAA